MLDQSVILDTGLPKLIKRQLESLEQVGLAVGNRLHSTDTFARAVSKMFTSED